MPRIRNLLIAALSLGLIAGVARAQDVCTGDCDGSGMIGINELITCVNIDLGTADLSTCEQCDGDGSGLVGINDLIDAVNNSLNGGCTSGQPFCGDGMMNVAGEECDDGNNIGGDGCAANCTNEIRRETALDPEQSTSTVQLAGLPIVLNQTGTQALTAGRIRDNAVFGPGGKQLFAPGEFPLVVKAADVKFNPINISGLACACVRALEVPEYGPGNAGVGSVGCGPQGLSNVDFMVVQDHDTSPGSPGNSGTAMGLPDDPECDDHFESVHGIASDACLEGVGDLCKAPRFQHVADPAHHIPAACNSPKIVTFSGGQGPVGSVLIFNKTEIGVLRNGLQDACTSSKDRNGKCLAADFGDDCLPCTDDDLDKGTPNINPTTSGTASVLIYDALDQAGGKLGEGASCGADPCVGSVTGVPTDCDALRADPNSPLTGKLVTAFTTIDGNMTGDVVTTTTLAAQH